MTNIEETVETTTGIHRGPGEAIWQEGQEVRPLRIQGGVVVYRRADAAIGMLGPGQIAVPVPGIGTAGRAATDLVALTETTAVEINPDDQPLTREQLEASVRAIILGAERLGNMSVPQRLAALLLDVTEMTGQPVVGCRQDIMAMAVASRRETVAVVLAVWRDNDWIQTRYRRVKVMEREPLLRIRRGED
jgi:CRP-like cAMP-binding protein